MSAPWLIRVLAWDGLLPIVVVGTGLILRLICRDEVLVGCVAVVLVPLFAALLRSHVALNEVMHACGGRAPLLRQLAIAAATVVLLAFEVVVNGLSLAKEEPPEAWAVAGGFYFAYLCLITWALRPPREMPGTAP
jgi:hypothetical protein